MSLNRKGALTNGGSDEMKSPNSCYFCNELFELGQLQLHLTQCGSILEQCPLRCGAWIQRKHRDTHVQDCPRIEKTRSTESPSHARPPDVASPLPTVSNHTWSPKASGLDDCVTFLEKEVANIKLIITEEVNARDVQSSDLETLRTKFQLLEERSQHFLSTVTTLRTALDEGSERCSNWSAQFKHDLANVQLGLQELQSQQLSTALRLESCVSSVLHEQRERELLEAAAAQQHRQALSGTKLEEVINYVKDALEEERARNAEGRAELEAELAEAKRSSEQLAQLSTVRLQLQAAVHERPALDRLAVLEVATADARAESAEQQSRLETLARDVRALTKSYLKIRGELNDFQTRVSFDKAELGCEDGHLIWRIDNFTARMKDAKENDAVLCSALFRTSKYGYTLKAEVNLNGIGKWKGRNITGTVRLVGGPYDPLLQWPCQLTVNIILKDQAADRNQAMDIVKSLELRRKSSSKRQDFDDAGEGKSTSTETLDKNILQLKRQYIFIPHTSLDKFDYVKNDVMFLEIVVNQ
ncbi:hypothetical protein JYU34_010017 [Plutella xylostella]|uniref:MATH domain-containing protein n=1 Tax=Plutella xylostella TaxID=51655 RepID=A0ABQ7QHJ5_PLUXY|nr:hypothetical protein JYU34_010017 [Plutella xylostella]